MAEGDDPTVTSADLKRVSERGPASEADGGPSSSAPSAPGSTPGETDHHHDDLRIGSLREEPQ
ncbi:hypothetical protein GCM10025864_16470 [Luteimicrobium album]|uniref:Uncharacterized protein n=1 Tax=Luteimicrobium album TaxID=1054550 RepID=A0ABQ6I1S5_9MICO|nr:hypothetical protein GCM10025864_16470 [Luteimicrobium album]